MCFILRDKRLDKEKELLNEQIILLTNDVAKYSKDIVNMRRENNSQIIALQTQLQQKDEEVFCEIFHKNLSNNFCAILLIFFTL